MNDGKALARNIPGGKRAAFENAFENFFHAEGEAVRFVGTFDLRFAVTCPENRGQLAETVETLVVHFDDDDAFEFREDFFEAVRQRVNVPQMERAGLLAMFTRKFHRVVDRPVGRTPTDEQGGTLLVAIDLDRKSVV